MKGILLILGVAGFCLLASMYGASAQTCSYSENGATCCDGDRCWTSTRPYVYEDGTWKTSREARSTMSLYNVNYKERDPLYDVTLVAVNETHQTWRVAIEKNLGKYDLANIKASITRNTYNETSKSFSATKSLLQKFSIGDFGSNATHYYATVTVAGSPVSSLFSFGGNSTTVGLDNVNGAILEDNWFLQNDATGNYGSNVAQGVLAYTTCPRRERSITKYNLTKAGIPGTATIDSATWNIFIKERTAGNMDVAWLHVTNQTWNEETTTYNTNPCSLTTNGTTGCNTTISSITTMSAADESWQTIDLTAIVSQAHKAGYTNVSWLGLSYEGLGECGLTSTIYRDWTSKEGAASEIHYLNITYTALGTSTLQSPANTTYRSLLINVSGSADVISDINYSINGGSQYVGCASCTTFENHTMTGVVEGPNYATMSSPTLAPDTEYFTVRTATIGNMTYDSYEIPGTSTTFTVNATFHYGGATFTSAYLNYNGTRYLYASAANNTNVITFSKTINTPIVAADVNMTFYWELYYTSPAGAYNINTTAVNQTVYIPFVGACSGSYVNSKRLVFLNETSPFAPVNASYEVYLELSTGGTWNYSLSGTNTTRWLCIGPAWASYEVDGQIRYTGNMSGEYETRDYFLDNATFDNETEDLNLYQTPQGTADRLTIQVQDQFSSPYPNAVVQIQRWYPELGAYKIVSAPKTDSIGMTVAYVTYYDVYYRFVVSYDAEIVHTTTASPISTASTDTFIITVGSGDIMDWLKYRNRVSGSCSYDNSSQYLNCSYSDTSGDMVSTTLTVYQQGALASALVCSVQNTTAGSGTIVCELGNVTNRQMEYWLVMQIGKGEITLDTGIVEAGWEATMLFRNCRVAENALACREGLFVAFLIMLVVGMVGMYHPAAAVVAAVTGLGFTWYVGLVAISAQTMIGLVFVGAVLVYRMRD